jgi:hypothetical protein
MFFYWTPSSGFEPLNYGWTLVVAIPVAFVGDTIAQSLEMAVIRRELQSKNLPLPPNQETVWDEYAQKHEGAEGSKRRKVLRALKWGFTYGFVEKTMSFFWSRQLVPTMLGPSPSFWGKIGVKLLSDLVYYPVEICTVFGLTAMLDYHEGFSYFVQKVKKDLCKVLFVSVVVEVIWELIFGWWSYQVVYIAWWVQWSIFGIYLDHMSHMPAQQAKDALEDFVEAAKEDADLEGSNKDTSLLSAVDP